MKSIIKKDYSEESRLGIEDAESIPVEGLKIWRSSKLIEGLSLRRITVHCSEAESSLGIEEEVQCWQKVWKFGESYNFQSLLFEIL